MTAAPTASPGPSLMSPTSPTDESATEQLIHPVPAPPGPATSSPSVKYVTYEVYLLPREWTPVTPGTHFFPEYPEDKVPRDKPAPTSMRPNWQQRQDDNCERYDYCDGRTPYVYRQHILQDKADQEAAQQTRLQSRRRPASVAGTKRKSSCPAVAAVVGEAPLPPSSPFEHHVVVENLDVDLAPPSVVIRELQPGDAEPVESSTSLMPFQVEGDDNPVILATVEQPPSPTPPPMSPLVE